jgi:hypothetical protein
LISELKGIKHSLNLSSTVEVYVKVGNLALVASSGKIVSQNLIKPVSDASPTHFFSLIGSSYSS